ncbi:ABC transporter permease [Sporolactobacillus shoreae]|uniref:ABC transporter permease n=1 Tax=Sporolactobacillus shoreae TaxID=1465501 RepID=A0A4Z0GQM3_9BACL|nr:ABC transporter permease [Sporolactobacillus shoreae]TGA99409.1 ABC transporter permease [Sporolactobacillus shoreae]
MTLFNLARRNMSRNFYRYFLYFASMIFSVMIFFTFVSIQFNHQVAQAASVKIDTSFKGASIVLIIFVAIFIWYSNSFFTKQRKKEVGLYALLGLRKKQIGRMLFYENLILGLLSLIIGMLIGMLLSKFFVMILVKLMDTAVNVSFSISSQAILETTIVFLLIIFLASLDGYRLIYRFQLIDLFRAERVGDKAPRVSALQSLLAVVLISGGYWMALQSLNSKLWHLGLLPVALMILFCVITGTFLLFRSLTVYFLKRSKRHKTHYYRGTNMISTGQLFYRIKGNARVLTVIATLSAITLCAVGTSFSIYYEAGKYAKESMPFSYAYIAKKGNQIKADNTLEQVIKAEGHHRTLNKTAVSVIQVKGKLNGFKSVISPPFLTLISESSFNGLGKIIGLNDPVRLNPGEGLILDRYYSNQFSPNFQGKEGTIQSKTGKNTTLHFIGYRPYSVLNDPFANFSIVVSDDQFHQLERQNDPLTITQINVTDPSHSGRLTAQLTEKLNPLITFTPFSMGSYYNTYHGMMSAYGLVMFLGAFLALVFLLATGSIIYFKQLTEAEQEKMQYGILRKIGVTRKEIKGAIAKQVGFVFALPLILGIAHSAVALTALSRMLNQSILIPVAVCMLVYTLIYVGYYFFTVQSYSRIVNLESR